MLRFHFSLFFLNLPHPPIKGEKVERSRNDQDAFFSSRVESSALMAVQFLRFVSHAERPCKQERYTKKGVEQGASPSQGEEQKMLEGKRKEKKTSKGALMSRR